MRKGGGAKDGGAKDGGAKDGEGDDPHPARRRRGPVSSRGRVSAWALLAHSTLTQAVTFLLRPASTYQALKIGVDPGVLGIIGATFALAPLLLAIPMGGAVNRLGERFAVVIGSVIVGGSVAIFLLLGGSVPGLILANAALGAGHLCCVVGQQTLIANTSVSGRLDATFGYYTFAASLGQALGPALIAAIGGDAVQPPTRPVFWLAAGLAGLVVLASLGIRSSRSPESTKRSSGGSVRSLVTRPGLLRALATSAVIVSAVDLTVIYLPALGAERGLPAALVGTLLTVRAFFSMISRGLLGRLSAALGRTRLMFIGIATAAVSLGVVAIPMPVAPLLVVLAAMGLGLGVGQPLTMSWLAEQTPAGQRGLAMSLRLAGNRVGQIALPSGMGLLAAGLGAAGVLAATAVAVGSTLLLLRGVRLEQPPE